MTVKLITIAAYLGIVFFLGYKGYKTTREASDYMLAGRKMNPFVMAMSYGATFVSTSAIIGFGGAAGLFGFSLLWLTFLTVFVGIFLAMTVFGKRTRRMGLALDSHTFPELLGRRYQSSFIQSFSGWVIFLFIPVYAAAVLIGISRMIEVSLNIPYIYALAGVTGILAVYVITGGLKAVMYTDALQGGIMVIAMLILLVGTYSMLGGPSEAHKTLTDMASLMPAKLQKGGMIGWTEGPKFATPLWLVIYTTIVYGVGFGVLAQPQLAVRYMTVPSDKELNRAVLYGGIFIPIITGVAFIVGTLSNAVFHEKFGKISIAMAAGNMDKIIPMYVEKIMPDWYSGIFLLAMFAAAMSTLSSQYHVGGTSLARDIFNKRQNTGTLSRSQIGVFLTIIAVVVWAWILPASVIARATAFFFGLCAATFLPMYFLGLYWKGMTKAGAVASMVGGCGMSMFWLLFIHLKEAKVVGLSQALFGKVTLVADATVGSWVWLLQWVDPNVVALPMSFLLAVTVSLATSKMEEKHLELCWANI